MNSRPRPVVLLILDGFGYSESREGNAIYAADTPVWDALWKTHPHALIDCSGVEVGLPDGQMGNSEVGHMHLGSGRLLPQDLTRINSAIEDASFFDNEVHCNAVDRAIEAGKSLHILGLLSPGGVHSHEKQLEAMAELAVKRGLSRIFIHAFLDGRDTPPKSADASIQAMEAKLSELGKGKIASIIGRFYAMDRDNRWDRVQAAYALLIEGQGKFQVNSASEGLRQAYDRGETDEFVQPTAITDKNGRQEKIEAGDVVVFMNFRSDRARELTQAINDQQFEGFKRKSKPRLSSYVTLTEYRQDFDYPVAYPSLAINNSLGEYLSSLGLKQLRIAETEKYAHVTFFFNGGKEAPFEGESRVLVPSPNVRTYDLQPEMSAPVLTEKLVMAIERGTFDVIVCNYANCDMVGHTGDFDAAVVAVEAVDQSLALILSALEKVGGELLVTADHGNVELMVNPESGQPHTAHTTGQVPLLYVGRNALLREGGSLSSVAPTMLDIMGLKRPSEMTGPSLVEFLDLNN